MSRDKDNSSIFDQIRTTSKRVAESAEHVQINDDKIDAYAASLPIDDIKNPPLDPASHYLGQGYDTIAFFLTLETINFGSGYFPHLKKRSDESGYFTVAGALNDHYMKNGPIAALGLSQLTGRDCASIFNQDWSITPMRELMNLFADALNQLGQFLLKNFNGQFEALLEASHHSAEELVNWLIQIPCFQDIADYDKMKVPLLKRAQITAADISLAFGNKGLGYFKDLDQLTIFADNMVPQVLRCDGILTYRDDLAAKIKKGHFIESGSSEEVEIRACAIHAVELIKERFLEKGHHFTSVDLDYLLWNRGQVPFYRTRFPIHITRSNFY